MTPSLIKMTPAPLKIRPSPSETRPSLIKMTPSPLKMTPSPSAEWYWPRLAATCSSSNPFGRQHGMHLGPYPLAQRSNDTGGNLPAVGHDFVKRFFGKT